MNDEPITEYETRNAVEIEPGVFDCEILHPTKGWLPFTSVAHDPEAHGKALHAHFAAGTRPTRQMTVEEAQARATMKREVAAMYARHDRGALLATTDHLVANDVWPTLTQSEQEAIAQYRQSLRDVPQQPNFPETLTFPDKITIKGKLV
jgi:hypothetical protein